MASSNTPALEEKKFKILDCRYEKQEQYDVIDDSTLIMAVTGPYLGGIKTSFKDLIFEYARPVALITEIPVCRQPPRRTGEADSMYSKFHWHYMYKSRLKGATGDIPADQVNKIMIRDGKPFANGRELIAVPNKP
jgi:hypothetical protein